MRRVGITWMMLAATALAVMLMLWGARREEAPVETALVTVARGNIADMAAITGRIAYTDETIAYAAIPGLVDQIYVSVGDRVAEGDALLRLKADAYEAVVSAWLSAAAEQDVPDAAALDQDDLQRAMEYTVVRAPMNGTVRQVFAAQNASVAPGTPVVLMSSSRQEIRCAVPEADVRRLQPGMWARLSASGEDKGIAYIESIGDVEADTLTGQTFCAVVLTPEQHIDLPGGASVDADVYIAGREDVPVLPVEAITERGTVWWVNGGRCTEIPAEVILNDEMYAWVNLPEGLTVALGEMQEGQRVAEVQQ
ncbi:MAG: HlyD family efflux transporter periplasmic adaptor subunit [Clostridia bacterium]|nr:HlyD family efflux transporter periplasmic adaptor subunit [Clostridia bacterium]